MTIPNLEAYPNAKSRLKTELIILNKFKIKKEREEKR